MKLILVICFLLINFNLFTQEITWRRSTENNEPKELRLFRSTQVINLPSAETYEKGDFEYEISHRFIPAVDEKGKFFGLDGPANIRFSLSYAPTHRMTLTVGRANVDGNIDFALKYKLIQLMDELFPSQFSIRFGTGWATNFPSSQRKLFDSKNFQFYAQGIFNTLYERTFGIGFVPTYLYNSNVYSLKRYYSFTLGSYIQVYLSDKWSAILEWNPTVTGYRNKFNPVAFGFELDTGGGHFFKFILSNSVDLNTSHFANGADKQFLKSSPSFGFNLTRILK
ncbi:MAG: DUF5777 family beta-barrel protein [Ignavibacterium sp.]|nr:DUF5777 family beta-barrel protein [Ignavibacterium sp.]